MISTKGRYALRVMLDLAQHPDDGYITLKDIAARQGISKKYLEIIVKKLVEGNMVRSLSGKGGGYQLNREPHDYIIGEILELTEGPLAPVACLAPNGPECPRTADCLTLPLWKEYNKLIHDFFFTKRLDDLLDPS